MRIDFDGFEWDKGNSPKVKDRVALEIVEEFFKQSVLVKEDIRHSGAEKRSIAVGGVSGHRVIFVAFTLRNVGTQKLVRVISARYTHKKERIDYEKLKKTIQENED